MKKYIAGTVAAAALAFVAMPAAAFQSVSITTMTASVTTGGNKVATFTSNIRNTSAPFGADALAITWTGVDPLTTSWKIADQLVLINSTVTDNNGGIRIYTDNTAGDAIPKFVDPTPGDANDADSRVASLLKNVGGADTSLPGLPMAWSIKTASKIVGGADPLTGIQPREPNDTTGAGSDNPFQWLYMTDKSVWDGIDNNNDGDFIDAGESAALATPFDAFTLLVNKSGEHYGQAPTDFAATPDGSNLFVYFQANFTGADVQQEYKTTALRIEAFIE